LELHTLSLRQNRGVTDPWARPSDKPSDPQPPEADPPTLQLPPESTQQLPTEAAPAPVPATEQLPPPPPPPPPPGGGRRLFRDPLSILLVVVIVVALALAGAVGIELYARHKADTVVATAAACVVEDTATASFGGATPFLWQHLNRHYSNISITTGGSQIRDMEGMKADIRLDDVRIVDSGDSKGTIGAMTTTVTWTADGIKQTVQQQGPALVAALQEAFSQYGGLSTSLLTFAQPLIESASKNLVTDVKTNPSSGEIELSGTLGHLSVKPTVDNGTLKLTASDAGFSLPLLGDQPLPTEAFDPLVSRFTDRLKSDLPLGLKPTSLEVTDNGIIAVLTTTNASIPKQQKSDCFRDI
jgi:hypothetical protein